MIQHIQIYMCMVFELYMNYIATEMQSLSDDMKELWLVGKIALLQCIYLTRIYFYLVLLLSTSHTFPHAPPVLASLAPSTSLHKSTVPFSSSILQQMTIQTTTRTKLLILIYQYTSTIYIHMNPWYTMNTAYSLSSIAAIWCECCSRGNHWSYPVWCHL